MDEKINIISELVKNKKIYILLEHLNDLDLYPLGKFVPPKFQYFFFGKPGFSPYKLLAYFSTLFNDQTLIEIGVHNGWGSLALSFNKKNKVIGYDIDLNQVNKKIIKERRNIQFKEGLAHELDPEIILKSPFIYFDGQHDGVYERTFFDFLIENNYKGLMLMDDIYGNEEMKIFGRSIRNKSLIYNLTFMGHETGTGLICFDGQEVYYT